MSNISWEAYHGTPTPLAHIQDHPSIQKYTMYLSSWGLNQPIWKRFLNLDQIRQVEEKEIFQTTS